MHVIRARNVNDAYALGYEYLKTAGNLEDSRGGQVLVAPVPVTTVYKRPEERVLFNEERDANPFFHLFEAIWMLAGHNDVGFLAQFVPRMREFSDNGVTFHGAYGYRWRHWFKDDQIPRILYALRRDPYDRRQVLTMWDPNLDLGNNGRDFPCNTQIFFRLRDEEWLDMTVTNRSNDIIWGCYGANAVHFSVLQEYMASSLAVNVGTYYQVSNNFHAYTEVFNKLTVDEVGTSLDETFYDEEVVSPLFNKPEGFRDDAVKWFLNPGGASSLYHNSCFNDLLVPMYLMWQAHKDGHKDTWSLIEKISSLIEYPDWRTAGVNWINRRRDQVA